VRNVASPPSSAWKSRVQLAAIARAHAMRHLQTPMFTHSRPSTRDMLEEGDSAPEFEAQTDSGSSISLAALRGRLAVLYFYPKDDTPG
jgi:hypothetical protein